MSPARRPLFALLTCLIVVGCDEDKLRCGAGTHEVDDACVPTLDTGPAVDSGDADDSDQDEDGFHTPTDCDDTNANVHPEAIEYCDGIDNDCDGQTDEDDAVNTTTFYIDADGDGYGDPDTTIAACAAPSGTVDDDTDCDDNAATTHPGAEEIWYDGIDNDCAEGSDDDADGDGYPGGSLDIDCDDTDPNIHPLAEEVCGDGIDNNCDADFGDCGFSGTVHLTDADASVLGHTADLSAGTSVRFAGDLDGDGTEDFLLGAPRYDGASGINAGGAFFVAGPLVGSEQLDTVGVAIVGATTADLAGTVVVPAGDIDGDGFDDILVGAPGVDAEGVETIEVEPPTDVDTGGADSGSVVVVDTGTADTGAADTGTADTGTPTPPTVESPVTHDEAGGVYLIFGPIFAETDLTIADATVLGTAATHGVGSATTAIGDQNGDGVAEWIVGAPGDGERGTDAGAVWVLYSPHIGTIDGGAGSTLSGVAAGDRAGATVLAAGDLNGDGIEDLVVGAPMAESAPPGSPHAGGDEPVRTDAGAVYVFLGPLIRDWVLDDADGIHTGPSESAYASSTLAALDDVDGDGLSDFAVGAPGIDGDLADMGAIFVLHGPAARSGSLAGAEARLDGDEGGAQAGASLSAAGDTNDDGHADLLVGAPRGAGGAGRVTLMEGPWIGTHTLDEGVAIFRGAGGDRAGTGLDGGIDANGDGIPDILIGAPGEDSTGDAAGGIFLFLGATD